MKSTFLTAMLAFLLAGFMLVSCQNSQDNSNDEMTIEDRLDQYTEFTLTADLSTLSEDQKKMIPLLIDAAKAMEKVFWMEAYGDKKMLMDGLSDKHKRFAEINYGPWDRLNGNEPFVEGVGPKPAGANFYPSDMTKEEFESWDSEAKDDLYKLVRRDGAGNLTTIPYH